MGKVLLQKPRDQGALDAERAAEMVAAGGCSRSWTATPESVDPFAAAAAERAAALRAMREQAAEAGEVVAVLHNSIVEQRELIGNQRHEVDGLLARLHELRSASREAADDSEGLLKSAAADATRQEHRLLAARRRLTELQHERDRQRERMAEADAEAAAFDPEKNCLADDISQHKVRIAHLTSRIQGLREEITGTQRLQRAHASIARREQESTLESLRASVDAAAADRDRGRGQLRDALDAVAALRRDTAETRARVAQLGSPDREAGAATLRAALASKEDALRRLRARLRRRRHESAACERHARLAQHLGGDASLLADLERASAEVELQQRTVDALRRKLDSSLEPAVVGPPSSPPLSARRAASPL